MVLGATITGLPALLIILVVLALLVIGFFVVARGVGRGVSKPHTPSSTTTTTADIAASERRPVDAMPSPWEHAIKRSPALWNFCLGGAAGGLIFGLGLWFLGTAPPSLIPVFMAAGAVGYGTYYWRRFRTGGRRPEHH